MLPCGEATVQTRRPEAHGRESVMREGEGVEGKAGRKRPDSRFFRAKRLSDGVEGGADDRLGIYAVVFIKVVHVAGLSEIRDAEARLPDGLYPSEEG